MVSLVESNFWDSFLGAIRTKLQRESFETWFNPIRFEGIDETQKLIRLRAPNQVVQDWVKSNYNSLIEQTLSELNLSAYSVAWIVPEDREQPVAQTVSVAFSETPRPDSPPPLTAPSVRSFAQGPATAVAAARQIALDPALNSKYTFENFVVGSCNQFAHAASLAVAEAPGKTYNPLYLYGGVGLGKTHLMHACGHAIKQRNPQLRVSYLSSERFMNELINSIRYDKTQSFREQYRSVDVLLIDDIQFMAGKERTQEEFFHTFNTLYEQQKQIVISSDCPPREIPTLEERLHSRFEWGLIADLEPPDLETKIAILKRKAEALGFVIPDEVALFIASRVKNNVRELEGSLIRLVAISSLRGIPVSKELAKDAIRNIASEEEPGVITIEQIQRVVATNYKLTVEQLVSKSNTRQLAFPRQIAMYLCKKLTKHSYPEIGRAFGGKHHTTVIHSCEKIKLLASADAVFQKRLLNMSEGLQK
ncbi:MAG TPA: chromosomal replication initiator protein DnaA [Pyrinomonadaceae bacterium]|jgi:chromosomal replication initiator protein|nr:chromosomal replication initiator protein DnaA [Pyrinomonadaceae bacterium]